MHRCVLASIIVVGLKGMLIQFRDLRKYWNVDKIDWVSRNLIKHFPIWPKHLLPNSLFCFNSQKMDETIWDLFTFQTSNYCLQNLNESIWWICSLETFKDMLVNFCGLRILNFYFELTLKVELIKEISIHWEKYVDK